MWWRTRCTLEFEPVDYTPFLFMLRPRSNRQQWVGREEYIFSPQMPVYEFADPFGNLCQRVVAPPLNFSIRTSADVFTADRADVAYGAPFVDIEHLPEDTLPYLLPSRYCESDFFNQMATEIVAGETLGYNQCACIADYIRRNIRYAPGTGELILSARDVNGVTEAVCRDMAHLGIALCRALAIPARMVVGYLSTLQPMDMHAWFEAYVGGRWYTFDSTQVDAEGARVAVGYGRDAADVAIYTQFGPPLQYLSMHVSMEQID